QLKAAGAAHEQTQARCGQLEQELAGLRQAREELTGKFAKEQLRHAALAEDGAESDKRVKELEQHLGQSAKELERAQAEVEKQRQRHRRHDSHPRSQLKAAGVAHEQAQARCGQLEQELAGLRQAREELTGKFAKEQQGNAESAKRGKEPEQHVEERAEERERAKAELEKQANERGRVESELRRQLEAANATVKQSEAGQKQTQARCGQLEQELAGLRQAREELTGKLTKEQLRHAALADVGAESGKRVKELEQHLGQSVKELERAKAEVEKQGNERGRVEPHSRPQLHSSDLTVKQSEAAQKQSQARCAQLEQELAGSRQAREELAGKFAKEQQSAAASR